MARNTAEFIHDILTLAELQGRLLIVDGKLGLRKLLVPAIVLAVTPLSCVPIALITLALTLVETASLTYAQAFGVALASGLLLAAILVSGILIGVV